MINNYKTNKLRLFSICSELEKKLEILNRRTRRKNKYIAKLISKVEWGELKTKMSKKNYQKEDKIKPTFRESYKKTKCAI